MAKKKVYSFLQYIWLPFINCLDCILREWKLDLLFLKKIAEAN